MSKTAKELGAEKIAKIAAAKEFLDSKKGDDGQLRMTDADVERARAEKAEIEALTKAHEGAMEAEGFLAKLDAERAEMNRVGNPDIVTGSTASATPARKSVEQILRESPEMKYAKERIARIEIPGYYEKATMTQAANGFPAETVREGTVVGAVVYPPSIEDIIPSFNTDQPSVIFMRQTVRTNAVAETAEGVALSEVTVTYAAQTAGIGLLGGILPITEQQLEDVPQLASIVSDDLSLMAREKRSYAFINANTSGGVVGFLNTASLGSQAQGADNALDAIYKGIVKSEVEGACTPSNAVMHPNTYRDYRLMRTVDGVYLWGNPSENAMVPIWGLPVTKTTDLAAGNALVGDFRRYAKIANRRSIEVEIGRNGTDFAEAQYTARVITRAGLVVYRPQAFTLVTGLTF